jgi:NTE family protein
MDAPIPFPNTPLDQPLGRPPGIDVVGLVLQGGGALGAYQAGVYEALQRAGITPDWVAGISIGSINGAIIAGNAPEQRLERLRAFWEGVATPDHWIPALDGDAPRRTRNTLSQLLTIARGQNGFFHPRPWPTWLASPGSAEATSLYDTAPLRETLLRLVDFDRLNRGPVRYAAGAVNVETGNFAYFDTKSGDGPIGPEHVMASGALPPGLPMVRIGKDAYWDGGLVSNTPLQHLLDNAACRTMLIFQVDLFSAAGEIPRDMFHVLARAKDIQYSSRTRMITDNFRQSYALKAALRRALNQLPDAALDDTQIALKEKLATVPSVTVLHVIYRHKSYETDASDYEFSLTSVRDHWAAGLADTESTLAHRSWLETANHPSGIVVHDVHREE